MANITVSIRERIKIAEFEGFFEVCKPDEELQHCLLYEPAFRKQELIYLEKEDVLVEQQMLRMRQQMRMTAKPVVGDKENSPSETGTMI